VDVGAQDSGAGRLDTDDRDAGSGIGGEGRDGTAEDLLRRVQLTGRDPGQAAADRPGRQPRFVPGGAQDPYRGLGDLG
jgi:hypothetical protein